MISTTVLSLALWGRSPCPMEQAHPGTGTVSRLRSLGAGKHHSAISTLSVPERSPWATSTWSTPRFSRAEANRKDGKPVGFSAGGPEGHPRRPQEYRYFPRQTGGYSETEGLRHRCQDPPEHEGEHRGDEERSGREATVKPGWRARMAATAWIPAWVSPSGNRPHLAGACPWPSRVPRVRYHRPRAVCGRRRAWGRGTGPAAPGAGARVLERLPGRARAGIRWPRGREACPTPPEVPIR